MDIDNLHIEFSVQYLSEVLFSLDFVQKYGRFNSPFFPIFISYSKFVPSGYLFLEANEDPLQEPRKIAKMSFVKMGSDSKVIIDVVEEGKNRWYTVEKIVRAILEDLWDKGYRINSVFPVGLLHPSKVGKTKEELLVIGRYYIEGGLIQEEIQNSARLSKEDVQPDLGESSSSESSKNQVEEIKSLDIVKGLNPDRIVKRYGTDRELTLEDVRTIVKECKAYQSMRGTVSAFYNEELSEHISEKFSYETLRSWLKDEKFKS